MRKTNAVSLIAVERERESYTLVNKGKSAVLFVVLRNTKNEKNFEHRLFIYVHFLCT